MHTRCQQQTQIMFDGVLSRVRQEMKGDSVYAFAKKLGISQQTADCYINGKRKPSLDFIYRVCSTCGCSADKLLGLPATENNRSVMTGLDDLRARADQTRAALTELLKEIDKTKKEAGF